MSDTSLNSMGLDNLIDNMEIEDDSELNHHDPENASVENVNLVQQYRSTPSLVNEVMRFYMGQATNVKDKIDQLAAEINQRQDRMRLINDLISEINNLTDETNALDISKNDELMQKLKIAKELGVKIKDGQVKFNPIERDRLIENLHLAADSWDKENRFQTQKMEIYVKELDRILLILKDVDKKEDQAKRPMIAGIRGS